MSRLLLSFGLFIAFAALPFYGIAEESKTARPFNTKVFGAWSLLCPEKILNQSGCSISQAVAKDSKGRNVLLGVTVYFAGTPKKPMIDFRFTPLAVPEAGIGMKIDHGDEFRLSMSECNRDTCIASGLLDEEMLARFKKSSFFQLAYMLPNRKQMTLPVSLNGFTEAFAALKVKATTTPEINPY